MKTWIKLVVATALVGTTMQAMSAEGRAVTPEGTRALKDIGAALRDLDAYEVQMKVTTRVTTPIAAGRTQPAFSEMQISTMPM